jgi:tRNA G18 (ribose-2'-O)-methylase SpoU
MGNLQNKKQKIYFEIFLHDIRSVQNVASIFRLADCIGAGKIVLSGLTPGPTDRYGRMREDFIKISLGAEKYLKTERVGEEIQNENFKEETDKENMKKALRYIEDFKKNGGEIIALEQDKKSVDFKKIKINKTKKYLIIPGREVEGIDVKILKKADKIAEISQYGKKESLNIFSSLSMSLYRWFDK